MAQSSDLSLIGIYSNLVLEAFVTNTAITASINFNVQVNPCALTDFTTNGINQEITYTIGESSVTSNPYGTAVQDPACNYPQTTEITVSPSLPAHITNDATGKTYTVNQITDTSLANTYIITVTH